MSRPKPQKPRTKQGGPQKRRAPKSTSGPGKDLGALLHAEMERCPTAEKLHDSVIEPFLSALVSVCNARGYVLNIYGEHCNLAVTPENHAEQIYRLVDAYLDETDMA